MEDYKIEAIDAYCKFYKRMFNKVPKNIRVSDEENGWVPIKSNLDPQLVYYSLATGEICGQKGYSQPGR